MLVMDISLQPVPLGHVLSVWLAGQCSSPTLPSELTHGHTKRHGSSSLCLSHTRQ